MLNFKTKMRHVFKSTKFKYFDPPGKLVIMYVMYQTFFLRFVVNINLPNILQTIQKTLRHFLQQQK